MLTLQDVSYHHPDKTPQFTQLYLTVPRHHKTGLIGANGVGKSTLVKLIAGELRPSSGTLTTGAAPYYIPQILGQFDELTVAQALGIHRKLKALREILAGNVSQVNLDTVGDDWTLQERASGALRHWKLSDADLTRSMASLSGGQKTRVFLAGITLHGPELILLDEPTNHLDFAGRAQLGELVRSYPGTILLISHDIRLLNLVDTTCEMTHEGLRSYGGNYDFYALQKQIERDALQRDIHGKEADLRKAMIKQRETLERKQKLDARGKKKQANEGVARIMMNTLRNNAEKSSSRIKDTHESRISGLSDSVSRLRASLGDTDAIRLGFDDSSLHRGKMLFQARQINYDFRGESVWKEDLDLEITSGERIALKGANGSGKSTLMKIILGDLVPKTGTVRSGFTHARYIDQDYSLIEAELSVFEQACKFNRSGLQGHEIKTRLTRFLFTQDDWDKPCGVLSGGEKMRLALLCVTIAGEAPEILLLDEPTNNMDIRHLEILADAVGEYRGTLMVVSHDAHFISRCGISRTISLDGGAS